MLSVPTGVDPKDQAYICPICGSRFISYRVRLSEPPGAAVIASRPISPRQPPRLCCSRKCQDAEDGEHELMCQRYREEVSRSTEEVKKMREW